MNLLISVLATLCILYTSCLNWRNSVKAVLVLLVIEGALRKWVLPQASDMIYFLKDLVLLGAYLRYYFFSLSERRFPIKNSILTLLFLCVTGWCLFQAFNPSLGSPIVGIFGLRGYLFYIPLIWMIPTLFQSEDELYKFLRTYLLLIIPVGILGIAQFFSPPSSPINAYVPGEVTNIATFGKGGSDITRITGTFSYISGYATYLIVSFGLLIPLLSSKQTRVWQLFSICELFFITVNSFMTGSRSVVIAEALFLIGYLGIKGFIQPAKTLNFLRKFLPVAIIIALVASIWFQPAIDAIWLRTTANQDLSERISDSFIQPFKFTQYKELDGYGTGATHPGGRTLRRALNLPKGEFISVDYESELGRVALEVGPIGFILWYGLRIGILTNLWFVFWKLKKPLLRELVLAAFLIHAIQINGHLVFHHTFSVYYWFLSSFIFLLPRLEQIENWQAKQQQLQKDVQFTYFPDSSYR